MKFRGGRVVSYSYNSNIIITHLIFLTTFGDKCYYCSILHMRKQVK